MVWRGRFVTRRRRRAERNWVGPGYGGPVLFGPKQACRADNEVLRVELVDLDRLHGENERPSKAKKQWEENVKERRRKDGEV